MPRNIIESYHLKVNLQYHIAKKTNELSGYLDPPSRGKLKKLCLELFDLGLNGDDLKTFERYFKPTSDKDLRTKIKEFNPEDFRALESFFLKKTTPSDFDNIQIASILVDFKPRPYGKFRKFMGQVDSEEEANEYRTKETILYNNGPAVTIPTKELVMEGEDDVAPIEEREVEDNEVLAISEIEKENEKPLEEAKNKFSDITSLISDLNDNDDGNNEEKKAEKINVAQDRLGLTTEISPPLTTDKEDEEKKIAEGNRARKMIYAITALVFIIAIGVAVKIQFFPYYDHMQWSGTQYVLAPMDSTNETNIERDDKMLRDFKRIYPTRKQVLFDKDDKGLIWYSRIKNDTYEFFSSEGPKQHPVTKHEIKRITRSIARDHIPFE